MSQPPAVLGNSEDGVRRAAGGERAVCGRLHSGGDHTGGGLRPEPDRPGGVGRQAGAGRGFPAPLSGAMGRGLGRVPADGVPTVRRRVRGAVLHRLRRGKLAVLPALHALRHGLHHRAALIGLPLPPAGKRTEPVAGDGASGGTAEHRTAYAGGVGGGVVLDAAADRTAVVPPQPGVHAAGRILHPLPAGESGIAEGAHLG